MENITEKIDIHIVRKSHIRLIILVVLITAVVSAGLFAAGLYNTVENIRSDAAAASNALSKEGAASASDVDLASTLRTSTVNRVIEGETFPSYSTSQIMSLDVSQPSGVTVSDLELVTTGGLTGLEEAFYQAEQDYGINSSWLSPPMKVPTALFASGPTTCSALVPAVFHQKLKA